MNIYIFNLSSTIGNEELKQLFAVYGQVKSAAIVNDAVSGESRGFGFVEMEDEAEACKAIEGLHHTELGTLTISVQELKPRMFQQQVRLADSSVTDVYKFGKN